jgi:hypothetical protein
MGADCPAAPNCPVSFAERWLPISAGPHFPALLTGIRGRCFQRGVLKQGQAIVRQVDHR